ncbi:Blue-light-activated protein [Tritonibacter multivorans]|uniref:histidine kinase n=1 Tax=Tritonibacter multivorans TaxID=928856 RepID=A0A0P1G7P2_9RHOB|nr:PAS domain S-box protein [Tritonibacter multivorans]MDA7422357.1 PAS domain S-box protein [Tritonibacter multivorans]CUH77694.1 Blue-light-activated protein [Tritonibacter multivorans]SFD14055.1 PAS/PAC sensor hybrid histidine kinase [Tritonibacter multivorans]
MNRPQTPIPIDRLRDRISELELQQKVDQQELAVSDALLSGVERMQAARTRTEVLAVVSHTLKEAVCAEQVFIIGDGAEAFFGKHKISNEVLYPPDHVTSGPITDDVMNWLKRRRNIRSVADLALPAPLPGLIGEGGSLLSAPFHREGGQIIALVCAHSDVGFFTSEHMRILRRLTDLVAHALRSIRLDDRHEVLASVVEYTDVPVMLIEPHQDGGKIVYVNGAFETMTGFNWQDMAGQRFQGSLPTPSPERLALRYSFQSGQPGRFMVWNKRKTGQKFLNEITLAPIRHRDGTLRYMLATHADVTEHIERQREIRVLEQRLETAMEAVSNAILVIDAQGETTYLNSAMTALFDRLSLGDLAPSEAGMTLFRHCETSADGQIECDDGAAFLLRAFRSSEGGKVITATDVTEMKEAKRILKERAVAMDSTAEGIAIADRTATLSYANPAFAKLFGASDPATIIGRKWCAAFAEEDVSRLGTDVRPKVEATGSATIEMRAPLPDGIRSFEVSVTAIDDEKRIIVAHDITDRLEYQAARANLDQKLQQFEKNESIGRLAAGVAHDFNNLLAVINGHAALLNSRTPAEKVELYAGRINEASSRAAKMINRFLDLGMSSDTKNMIDLRTLMTESEDLLRSVVSAETTFSLHMEDREMEMLCFPSELLRVALNLVQNAQDALDGAPGDIRQSLCHKAGADLVELDMQVGVIDPDVSYARYTVADSGSGIPPDVMSHLFRDHYSTKGQRGSGIGMMAIAEIIADHEGAIRIDTELGRGTTIEIYLPLSDLHMAQVGDSEIGSVRLDKKLILVVDDDAPVGESIAAYLERLGAEVSVCIDPKEALEIIKEDPGLWSLIVSDYNMPGLNGGQLAKSARETDPDLPFLIVTALARKLSDPNLNDDVIAGLLAKPVDLNALAHLIERHAREMPKE